MSLNLTRYDSRALAAGALHQALTQERDILREIRDIIPPQRQAIIKFVLVADSTEPGVEKVYHAATAHFKREGDKGLTVNATIASYAEGRYTSPCKALTSSTSQDDSSSGGPEREPVNIRRYPLLSSGSGDSSELSLISPATWSDFQRGFTETNPMAMRLFTLVSGLLRDGIPLPHDQRFHHFSMMVSVENLNGTHQLLDILAGTRGTGDPRSTVSPWSSFGTRAEEQADRLVQDAIEAAAGRRRLREIPVSASPISQVLVTNAPPVQAALESRSTARETAQIEQVDE